MAALLAACLFVVSPAQAQDAPAEELGRFRFGPIRFTPSVQITNLGIDTNVFNEYEDPKQDFTVGMGPKVEFWMRLGRARLQGTSGVDYNYFREYESQRFWGTTNRMKLSVPLNRIVPFVEGGYTNTRQRPGYEIDARARRTQADGRAGLDLKLGARSKLTFAARVSQYRFEADEAFLGSELSEALDNDADAGEITFERQLTPLTTLVFTGEQRRDRFVYSPERDADASRVAAGFDFKPFALISGSIRVGWRQFETLEAAAPDYSGVTAVGDLGYALRATRFNFRVARDIEYSFQQTEPFYLLTDLQLEVMQRITASWDVVGRVARQTLDYSVVELVEGLGRTDTVVRYGGGVGYRLGEYVRFGLDIDWQERTSDILLRGYEAWRLGGSVTYGIKQQ